MNLIHPAVIALMQRINTAFTTTGLEGLSAHAAVTNILGEKLARKELTPEAVAALWQPATVTIPTVPVSVPRLLDLGVWDWGNAQAFNQCLWDAILGKGVVTVPALPKLRGKTIPAFMRLNMKPFYFPSHILVDGKKMVFTEVYFPQSFILPAWSKYLTEKDIKRRAFPGRWTAVEVCQKPDWNDPMGYGADDALVRELHIATPIPQHAKSPRFGHSQNDLREGGGILHRFSSYVGISRKASRLMTAEERNLFANILLWMNANLGTSFPNLGATNSWEHTENEYGSGDRLLVGCAGYGGLACVFASVAGDRYFSVSFRVLAVL